MKYEKKLITITKDKDYYNNIIKYNDKDKDRIVYKDYNADNNNDDIK